MASDWFDTGFDATSEQAKKADAQRDAKYGPTRYWMPADSEKEISFVDDEPVGLYEHNPQLNGSYRNWITCDNDVCCEELASDSARYYVGFFTVVDMTKWSKDGKDYQFGLKLYPAKSKTLKKLKRKKEKTGALTGKVVEITREDKKSPNVGDSFDFGRDVNAEKMFKVVNYRGKLLSDLWDEAEADSTKMEALKLVFQLEFDDNGKLLRKVVPFNYFEILKPKGPEWTKEFLGVRGGSGSGSDSGSSGRSDGPGDIGDDDIPF